MYIIPITKAARDAFARYIAREFGDEAAFARLRDIHTGREDADRFIVGYRWAAQRDHAIIAEIRKPKEPGT